MSPDDILAIDAAAASSGFPFQVSQVLRSTYGAENPPDFIAALILALDYDEVRPSETERRAQWGPFAPMVEAAGGLYPPPLATIQDDTRQLWETVASQTTAPLVRARLNDLLWEARHGASPHQAAREAIRAYLDLASDLSPGDIARSDSLARALEIALSLSDPGLIATCADASVAAASDDLGSPDGAPGVALSLLESLARLPRAARPSELAALLSQAMARYAADPWLASNVADIELSVGVGSERRDELIDRKIQAWEAAAGAAEGLVAATHLERALEIAQQNGRSDKADGLRVQLQQMGETIELQKLDATVAIERDKVEAYLGTFLDTDDVRTALARFASHCPLPESRDETADYVRNLMQQHPLQYLFTKVVLGPGNVPIQIVSTEAEHFESAMTSHEAMSIELWSLFAADVLDRIQEKFDPDRDEIRSAFQDRPLTSIVAGPVSEAFELYWMGRFDAAMMTALPRIETVVRDLSRRLGLVIFVEPQSGRPGKFKVLGELLRGLAGRFDERRRHYLLNALASPLSYNLRNNALHGITLTGSREQAAIALHAVTLFTLFTLDDDSESEG